MREDVEDVEDPINLAFRLIRDGLRFRVGDRACEFSLSNVVNRLDEMEVEQGTPGSVTDGFARVIFRDLYGRWPIRMEGDSIVADMHIVDTASSTSDIFSLVCLF